MTTFKLLSAGLIVAAAFVAPVSARENCAAARGIAARTANGLSAVERCFGGRLWIPAPSVSAHSEAPTDQPGGVCDHGDDAQIC
ncbi:hypothetical protein H8A99_14975 [Bradyrhizobium sp. Arg68]|uniref:hypothetical protein n=1 Tax=Bradyrhizobium ivorense TaxID=2511166 RepID=UPI001E342AC5|nr:hypothetical protein [Bradyrhizobium ivorense]MCC8937737.1 hypothetical protein [Bradyrhizobium ivorense]